MAAHARRHPIFASDIRQLGGVVSVHIARDRCGGDPTFRVSYISGGGDLAFSSLPIAIEDHANAAARVLAELVGGKTLEIEAQAKRRLADEYDAAQDRGEVQKHGGQGRDIPDGNIPAKVREIGLTAKDIHEARIIRDGEKPTREMQIANPRP